MTTNQHLASASLLSRIDWRAVGANAAKELSNREVYAPVVSAYRWWARRPHGVMGAILDAAVAQYGPALTIADPFSGGGTVTFEAAKRGLKAYAQDLYPWPTRGLATALGTCDPLEFNTAAQTVLAVLQPHRETYLTPSGAELSHVLRVRVAACQACGKTVYEFPHALVSLASRRVGETEAYFGCRLCGYLTRRPRCINSVNCDGCGVRCCLEPDSTGCPHCSFDMLRPKGWHAALVQELTPNQGRLRATLRPVRANDPVGFKFASLAHQTLLKLIPAGKETKRLLDNGFKTWGDLYTQRQADVLVAGLRAIASLESHDPIIKDRLAFAFLGAAEMPAFLSRWDRFNLKPFEGMANHRYTQTTLAVESNLLSPVGRGTIPRRLEAAAEALEWLIALRQPSPKVAVTTPGKRGRRKTDWDVLVTTGSSVKQALRSASVNVVVTDPPYFDDVQYGELARLFHVWLSVYDPQVVVDESAEAVPNSVRGTSSSDYEAIIAACLRESCRTLKADGKLILTFHNKKVAAWRALAGAFLTAGLRVTSLAAVLAENRADHCKRNVNAMLHDLVIECVPARGYRLTVPSLEFAPESTTEKNLAAMGLALAECVSAGDVTGIVAGYLRGLTDLGASKRLIE